MIQPNRYPPLAAILLGTAPAAVVALVGSVYTLLLWGEQEPVSKQSGEDNRRPVAHLDDRQLASHRYRTTQNRETPSQSLQIGNTSGTEASNNSAARTSATIANNQGQDWGLAITKGLMTQMGGDAGFESLEGHGSTFWLWLPKQ